MRVFSHEISGDHPAWHPVLFDERGELVRLNSWSHVMSAADLPREIKVFNV